MLTGDLIHEGGAALREGARRLSPEMRERHVEVLAGRQNADGGWVGRSGASDIYYTSFALRAADLLAVEREAMWVEAAGFLRNAERPSGVVDTFCRLASWAAVPPEFASARPRPGEAVRALDGLRRDGAYAHHAGGPRSVYMTFLAARCHEVAGVAAPYGDWGSFVLSRRNADGGFGDTGAESGINPTAAAALLLAAADALTPEARDGAARYMVAAQRGDGGFGAHHAAPTSDLLSTYSALVAMDRLGRARDLRLAGAEELLDMILG